MRMKKRIKIFFFSLFSFGIVVSCSYEFTFQGEMGTDLLPRGDENASFVSLAVRETENLLLVQVPFEADEGKTGKILCFSLSERGYTGPFIDEGGDIVEAQEIFTTPEGLLGAVTGNLSPSHPDLRFRFYDSM